MSKQADDQESLHHSMLARDSAIGGVAGAGLGGALAHYGKLQGGLGHAGVIGGTTLAGLLLGGLVGHERAQADKVKQQRHVADREQAQQHRKDLINMKKESSDYESVMYAAMADELSHIAKEKVAINLAPVMGAVQGLASRAAPAARGALSAVEGLGSSVVRGLESAGHAGLSHAAPLAQQAGQGVISGLNGAERMVGGAQNLNRLAGGAALGVGALGAAGAVGAAHRATSGRQPTQIVVR